MSRSLLNTNKYIDTTCMDNDEFNINLSNARRRLKGIVVTLLLVNNIWAFAQVEYKEERKWKILTVSAE